MVVDSSPGLVNLCGVLVRHRAQPPHPEMHRNDLDARAQQERAQLPARTSRLSEPHTEEIAPVQGSALCILDVGHRQHLNGLWVPVALVDRAAAQRSRSWP
eukprot:CAMPEP_0115285756 /NCGR_PEP_ID=MMETSP0270-20121206/61595_1 /TAXON_ID=71861 /ORGANISM="Scrippsiella trochoidea, Strain CCMP3099" /LENGTH=100 /DNA_ID=CAMNT_0002702789 /DNA_START=731 /DNA_END=1033 /DNA_ORIENTATION=-